MPPTQPLPPIVFDSEPLWPKKRGSLVCLLHVYNLEPIMSCSSSLGISVPLSGRLFRIKYAFCWEMQCIIVVVDLHIALTTPL